MEEEDLDRPVTLREFRNEFKMLIEKISADRLQDRKEREEDKAKAETDRIKRKELKKAEVEQERINKEEMKAAEREKVQKLWEEGKMVECLHLFFRMNQGNHCCNDYRRVKVE